MDQNLLQLLKVTTPNPSLDEAEVSRARKARVKRRYISVPLNLTLTPTFSDMTLSWDPPATYEAITGYKILSGGVEIADVPASPTPTYTHTDLTPSTTYSYSIYAYNQYGGTSGMLEGSQATTPAP